MKRMAIQLLGIFSLISLSNVFATEEMVYAEPILSEITVSAAEAEQKLIQSVTVLKEVFNVEIPTQLLQHTEAIVILPNMLRVSLVIGGKIGTGVLLFRLPTGEWSSPLFVLFSGGSIGLQLGVSSSDMVLFFRRASDLAVLESGQFTLTALAAVAAGSLGTAHASSTDLEFQADIYVWLRNKGLFLGLALEGALLDIDTPTTQNFYNTEINFQSIRDGSIVSGVSSVIELRSLAAELMAQD